MRTIRADPEILRHAANDAINRYVRDVLIPSGVIDEEALDAVQDELEAGRQEVIQWIVDVWREWQISDE